MTTELCSNCKEFEVEIYEPPFARTEYECGFCENCHIDEECECTYSDGYNYDSWALDDDLL